MIVKGLVSEIAKKAKSYKVTIDGHAYYCKEDVNSLAGKSIEAEYEEQAWKDKEGKEIKSKWLNFTSIKIGGASHTTPEPSKTAKNSVSASNLTNGEGTDWEAKNRIEHRRTIWDSVFMTVYPILSKAGSRQEIIDTVDAFAEAGVKFAYFTDKDIKL